MFDAGNQTIPSALNPSLVDTEGCSEDGSLVDVDGRDPHGTVDTEGLKSREDSHSTHSEHYDVGDGSYLQVDERLIG